MSDISPLVAVRAPEFLPRLSYLGLIDAVDVFVVADCLAYSRQSHHNRAPIRTPDGRMWLTLPLEHGARGRPIREVRLSDTEFDAGRLWRSIRYNYGSTPYFAHYGEGVRELLYGTWPTLGALSVASVRLLADALRIETDIRLPVDGSSELADILGSIGGRYVASEETTVHDSTLVHVEHVHRFASTEYHQAFEGFQGDLSGLDLLMNWGPSALSMIRERGHLGVPNKSLVKPARSRPVG